MAGNSKPTRDDLAPKAKIRRKERASVIPLKPPFYERILEIVPMAVTVLDPAGRLVYVNQQAERLFGVPRRKLLGKAFDEKDFSITSIQGDPVPQERLPFSVVINTRRPVVDLCHAVQLPNQYRRILSICGTPFLDNETGEVQYVVFSLEDITDQLQTAEELGRVRTAIEGAVSQPAAHSDTAREAAELRAMLGSLIRTGDADEQVAAK